MLHHAHEQAQGLSPVLRVSATYAAFLSPPKACACLPSFPFLLTSVRGGIRANRYRVFLSMNLLPILPAVLQLRVRFPWHRLFHYYWYKKFRVDSPLKPISRADGIWLSILQRQKSNIQTRNHPESLWNTSTNDRSEFAEWVAEHTLTQTAGSCWQSLCHGVCGLGEVGKLPHGCRPVTGQAWPRSPLQDDTATRVGSGSYSRRLTQTWEKLGFIIDLRVQHGKLERHVGRMVICNSSLGMNVPSHVGEPTDTLWTFDR